MAMPAKVNSTDDVGNSPTSSTNRNHQDFQWDDFGLCFVSLLVLCGRVRWADKEAHAHLFYPDKSLLSDEALSIRYPGCVYRRGLQLFKNAANLVRVSNLLREIWGQEALVLSLGSNRLGMLEMLGLICSLKCFLKACPRYFLVHEPLHYPFLRIQHQGVMCCVDFCRFLQSTLTPFHVFGPVIDINVNPSLPSENINYLENPMEIISEAENAAENCIWSLMQFTECLRRQYGKEPFSMEILLKKAV
ncbi:hypothetical protein Patl1_07361 [Pistacia atlantica]|uniref:Uncharacterized protein n=1 Tax=Pistacia atlantica TaxID=434234 RepID=A0ACC1AK06_9ROSI|nr:hypothetical protein Patl1_07361 [Pistacia atlantica]